MKSTLAIIGVAAAIVAAYLLVREEDRPRLTRAGAGAPPPAAVPHSPPAARAPRANGLLPRNQPIPQSAPAARADFDPMLVLGLGDFSDEEIARYNSLHILPFNKAIGQECEELPDPHFLDQMYTACETVRENPEHPYAQLDNAALLELAVHDEVAALMLGRRAQQEEERVLWYLRAAALSGKSGPLMSLAHNRYNVVHELKNVDGKFRAVPQLDRITVRIALDTVAGKMGDPRANPARWQLTLRELAADRAPEYLARAEQLAGEFLQAMAQTQREITGSVQIQEIIDNA